MCLTSIRNSVIVDKQVQSLDSISLKSEEATGIESITFKYHLKMKVELLQQAITSMCLFVHLFADNVQSLYICVHILVYDISITLIYLQLLRWSGLLTNSIYIFWKVFVFETLFQVLDSIALNNNPRSHGPFILVIRSHFY